MRMIEKQKKYFGLLKKARSQNTTNAILFKSTFTSAQRILVWLPFVLMPLSCAAGIYCVIHCQGYYYWIFQLVMLAGLFAVLLISRHILLRHDVTGSRITKWPSMNDRLYSIFISLLDKKPDGDEDLPQLQKWLEAAQLAKPKILNYTFVGIFAYLFAPVYGAFAEKPAESRFAITFSIVLLLISLCITFFYNLLELLVERKRIETAELHRYISMYIAERKRA